jgi:hypothetical protein
VVRAPGFNWEHERAQLVQIFAGAIGLASGFVALSTIKGATLHARAASKIVARLRTLVDDCLDRQSIVMTTLPL